MKKQNTGNPEITAGEKINKQSPALSELLKDGLSGLYWAEQHLTKALPKMISAATDPALKKAIGDHLKETTQQCGRLEQAFAALGETPLAKKCHAMEGLTKEAEGMVEQTPPGSAVRDLGIILASKQIEYFEIASYTGLSKLADNLGLKEVSVLLKQSLKEEQAADDKLGAIGFEDIINQAAGQK